MASQIWRTSPIMSRKKTRIRLMQYAFELDAKRCFVDKTPSSELMKEFRNNAEIGDDISDQIEYFEKILIKLIDNIEEIDRRINDKAMKWDISRMPKVDLAICRVATSEMLFFSKEITPAVSINEAVEMAKKYSTVDSHKYVNAVLGRIASDISNNL